MTLKYWQPLGCAKIKNWTKLGPTLDQSHSYIENVISWYVWISRELSRGLSRGLSVGLFRGLSMGLFMGFSREPSRVLFRGIYRGLSMGYSMEISSKRRHPN